MVDTDAGGAPSRGCASINSICSLSGIDRAMARARRNISSAAAERSRARESIQEVRSAFEERRHRGDELRLRHGVQGRDLHQLPRYVVIEYGARSSGT